MDSIDHPRPKLFANHLESPQSMCAQRLAGPYLAPSQHSTCATTKAGLWLFLLLLMAPMAQAQDAPRPTETVKLLVPYLQSAQPLTVS